MFYIIMGRYKIIYKPNNKIVVLYESLQKYQINYL